MIFGILILVSGCSAGLKSRWTDFNAYFNTFYNAQASFEKGHRLIRDQAVVFNPARPIRAHLTPVRAGQTDFEKAIEKGANILRKYPQSRWADDALELIGKSYFMLGQYFSADLKFNEVIMASSNPVMRQRAVVWKALVYLETNRPAEGIRYIESQILSEAYDWKPEILAELRLVQAQLHMQTGQTRESETALRQSLDRIEDKDVQARGRFLHGQVLHRLGDYDGAYKAYDRVNRAYRDYHLIYLAEVEKGRLLREMGRHSDALRHFQAMTRDDKHFDQLADLNYEIAVVRTSMGDATRAESEFKDVLYRSLRPPSRVTQAMSHYQLAELNRFVFARYPLAAAHYDTSSRLANDLSLFPEGFDAASMARVFGDFARLSREIHRTDSLLTLGTLPRAERDSLIDALRLNRLREYEIRLREQQRQGTTLVTVPGTGQTGGTAAADGSSGFLNHRNPQLVEQSAQAFAAMWQGRPLVDNWRRLEATRNARVEPSAPQEGAVARAGPRTRSDLDGALNIHLAEIPTTSDRIREARHRLASLHYEIGNLFYLTLFKPDSAAVYYRRAVTRYPDAPVAAQAYYSLADMALASADTVTARRYSLVLAAGHSGTPFEIRLAERLGLRQPNLAAPIDSNAVRLDSLMAQVRELPAKERAHRMDLFASASPRHPRSGDLMYAAALTYGDAALWDSTKVVLDRFMAAHPRHASFNLAKSLHAELLRMSEPSVMEDSPIAGCAELDQPFAPRGGIDAFLASFGFRESMASLGVVEADFEFQLTLDETGSVLNAVPITERDDLGLLDALLEQIRESLSFFPPTSGGTPVRATCDYAIIVKP